MGNFDNCYSRSYLTGRITFKKQKEKKKEQIDEKRHYIFYNRDSFGRLVFLFFKCNSSSKITTTITIIKITHTISHCLLLNLLSLTGFGTSISDFIIIGIVSFIPAAV